MLPSCAEPKPSSESVGQPHWASYKLYGNYGSDSRMQAKKKENLDVSGQKQTDLGRQRWRDSRDSHQMCATARGRQEASRGENKGVDSREKS